jgi:Protein of unknown function (DUF4058)
MASPFLGMNPYLEGSLWQEICTYLMTAIANDLNARLPDTYRATVEQATYIATSVAGSPDVTILGDAFDPKVYGGSVPVLASGEISRMTEPGGIMLPAFCRICRLSKMSISPFWVVVFSCSTTSLHAVSA